jgi:hypothetical protein
MKKKELWMEIGNTVDADGDKGIITDMEIKFINNCDYVTYFFIIIVGSTSPYRYSASMVNEFKS